MDGHRELSVRRGAVLIGGAAVAWGIGGVVAAFLFRTSGLGPIAVSFWRFVVASVALGAFGSRRTAPRAPVSWGRSVTVGACLALCQTSYFGAVQDAGVAQSTLIALGAGPVLIALAARVFLGERLSALTLGAIAVALVGILLLAGAPSAAGPHPVEGVGLALACAAGYTVVTVVARAGGGTGVGASFPVFAIGTLCLLPFALSGKLIPHAAHLPGTLISLVFLGTVPTLLAYRWYFSGLTTVPAATASLVALLEPVTAALLGLALLDERLTATALVGAVLLLATAALLGRASAAAD